MRKRPKLTVIFDRSAFHGDRFDLLAQSRLLALVKRNVILVHHPLPFLEETISMYEKEKNRDQLRKQLLFLLDICNGRWFREPSEIWNIELAQNRGATANVFEDEKRRRKTEANIRRGVLSGGDWKAFWQGLPEKDAQRQRQANYRRILGEIRQSVASTLKQRPELKRQKPPGALEFINTQIDDWGAKMISRYVGRKHRDKSAIVSMWRHNKQRYPFVTSSFEGQIFAYWQAAAEHNKPIDGNAIVDVDVLTCLHRADAIVSADNKFLRDAFDLLWRPKGKTYFSPQEFVARLQLFAP